jgi:ribosomal-protein-alanine N-acetyltransferase
MTMPEVSVSVAQAADAQAIRELLLESSSSFDVDAEFRRSYARLWLARTHTDARPLGVALTWEVADEVHLIDLMVAAAARRQGLGRALLQSVLSQAERGRFRVVLLEVRRDNQPARALYAALGFEVSGEREKYYSDGEDALLMQRVLEPGAP